MAEPVIEIKGLGKSFKSKNGPVVALRDINLTVEKGDIFGIIGMSGAGKSTLVRCINLLERPTEGAVIFDGQDMCRLSSAELNRARRSMGMIFQQFNLLMQRSAEANVRFPMEIPAFPMRRRKGARGSCWSLWAWANALTITPRSFPAGRNSASPSPAPCLPSRRCCSATRRPPLLTPPPRHPF